MFSQFDSTINMPYAIAYTYDNNNMIDIDDELPPVGTSPTINTPYLDSSSIDTPYLDNNSTSPFLDTVPDFSPYLMYASFGQAPQYINNQFNGVRNMNDDKDDVCIARYLDGGHENNKGIANLMTHDPIAKFNGDPTALLIDKSKSPMPNIKTSKPSPTIKLETVTEENSDSLFPPLTSSQSSTNSYDPSSIRYDSAYDDKSLDDILGFESSSPLSSADDNDFDILQDEEAQQPKEKKEQVKDNTVATSKEQQVSGKRKDTSTTAEASNNTSATKKRKTSTKTAKKPAKEPKLFQCPLCDHVSKRRYNLSTHIKTHDKTRIKEFSCTQCTKSFDRRHDRDRHLATVHRGERSYACDHCTIHFSRRDALDRHLIQKHEYDESDLVE